MSGAQMRAREAVLSSLAWPGAGLVRALVLVLAGAALLTLSAKLQVPFWPVPMTMQTLVVLVLGIAYGARLGTATVLGYLAAGIAGLPVFAGVAAGPAYMTGPTAGYLVGFAAAAAMLGRLAERGWDRRLGLLVAAACLGHAVIFVAGLAWLAVLFGWSKAVAAGLAPFIWATVLKTVLAVALLRGLRLAVRRAGAD